MNNLNNQNQRKIKLPIVLSSDLARKKFEENLLKLQRFESQFQQQPMIVEENKKQKQ